MAVMVEKRRISWYVHDPSEALKLTKVEVLPVQKGAQVSAALAKATAEG